MILDLVRQRMSQRDLGYSVALFLIALTGLGGVSSISGCSGDTTGDAAVVAPSRQFWSVRLNYRAVNLALVAPYDTVRLVAIPLDASGHAMPDAGAVTFQTKDSTVTVDPTGLATAHYITNSVSSPTYVAASFTVNGKTHSDTAWIQVVSSTATHVPLATFSVQPAVGDSARMAVDYWDTDSFDPFFVKHPDACNRQCWQRDERQ